MKPFVLVVDDDRNVASMVSDQLADRGYRTTVCYDAAQAFIQAQNMKVGLIVTDINMPGFGSGLDAYKRIREAPEFANDLPIIFLTALTPEQIQPLMPKGDPRVRLLHKPTTMQKLLTAVRELTGETLLQDPGQGPAQT